LNHTRKLRRKDKDRRGIDQGLCLKPGANWRFTTVNPTPSRATPQHFQVRGDSRKDPSAKPPPFPEAPPQKLTGQI